MIPSPYAGVDRQKVVYITANSPFISVVKRVRKLLKEIDKRSMGKIDLINGKGSDKQKLKQIGQQTAPTAGKEAEEVVLKATNRAIEKVLGIALYFQGQDDCRVRLRTGSLGVVDDIIDAPVDIQCDDGGDGKEADDEVELLESRIRKITAVEVAIALK